MSKSKLDKAVADRADELDPAQRELVMSQFSEYKRNKTRIYDINEKLKVVDSTQTVTLEEVRLKQAERSALTYELNQLSVANSRISSDLFQQLGKE